MLTVAPHVSGMGIDRERHPERPLEGQHDGLGEGHEHSGGRVGRSRDREAAPNRPQRYSVKNGAREIDLTAERPTDDR